MSHFKKLIFVFIFSILFTSSSWAKTNRVQTSSNNSTNNNSLIDLPLEQLMDIQVISASKKSQKISQSATAIYVITAEDLRRMGVTSVMEALRMAPGVQVTRSTSQNYSITARGFSQGLFANKMLVLIDGRSAYSPLFAGVYWDVQDINIESIDRIEVIRGSNAVLWGANAVNGVINIYTKHSKDTQGGLITAGGGLQERAFGSFRYGGTLKDGGTWRAIASYFNRDNFSETPGNIDHKDDWSMVRGDVRMDWDNDGDDSLMLQGSFYVGDGGGRANIVFPTAPFSRPTISDTDLIGGHLLGRWIHTYSNNSKLTFLSYLDHHGRDTVTLHDKNTTLNFETQYDFNWGKRQEITLGTGYRFISDRLDNTFSTQADPTKGKIHLFQAFIRDEIALVKNKLKLILSGRIEDNSYTDFEPQYSGRLLYTPNDKYSLWVSSTRAVRSPTRLEDNSRLNTGVADAGGGATVWTSLIGDSSYKAEQVWDNEFGYRFQPIKNLSFDISAFYNKYYQLRTIEAGTPFVEASFGTTHGVIPYYYSNMMEGRTYGVEVASEWQVFKSWRLAGSYSYLNLDVTLNHGSTDPLSVNSTKGASPSHQFNIRSYLNLPYNLEFDTALYYVGSLPTRNTPRYTRVDARLGWKATPKITLSVVGQNVFDARHSELTDTTTTEVDRAVYGKFTLQF